MLLHTFYMHHIGNELDFSQKFKTGTVAKSGPHRSGSGSVSISGSNQRYAGSIVQESTPEGVTVFLQEPEQDQKWNFFLKTGHGPGSGVIF